MSFTRRTMITAAAFGAAFGLMAPAAQADTRAAWSGCATGEICVYQELNGGGKPCHWDGEDNDWENGNITCSWAGPNMHAKSIWNRGTGSVSAVKFYKFAYFNDFYACAAKGFKGNTGPDAGVHIQSHKWATSC
ncbi:peptidase inhibitor family I36 protein [Streptomyces sp. NPDC004111]|uniref:peptidase inhibitor family I36 protein n=1 Tax=Streptomyces sp. NPDC004111 TaxID=3364690 RepID=UPI003675D222